MHAVECNQFAV